MSDEEPTSIRARAVEGRIARLDPHGDFIPWDQYINIPNTPYIQRLLNWHGDIELEPEVAPPPPPQVAEAPTQPTKVTQKKETDNGN